MTHRRDPYLDAGMRGFIKNNARKEFWRVASWYEFEDLVQDGYLCYYKCRSKYRDLTVKNHPSKGDRKHMMALVRTTFSRHVHDLSKKCSINTEIPVSQWGIAVRWPSKSVSRQRKMEDANKIDVWDLISEPVEEEVTFSMMLSSAPVELKQLMQILVGDGAELLGFKRSRLYKEPVGDGSPRETRRKIRETTNQYYCRLLNLDPDDCDLVGMMRDYFSGKLGRDAKFNGTGTTALVHELQNTEW